MGKPWLQKRPLCGLRKLKEEGRRKLCIWPWALRKAHLHFGGDSIAPSWDPALCQALTGCLGHRTQRDTVLQEVHSLAGYLSIDTHLIHYKEKTGNH